jgi:hypothetical protein
MRVTVLADAVDLPTAGLSSPIRIVPSDDPDRPFRTKWVMARLGVPAWFKPELFATRLEAQRAICAQFERWLKEPTSAEMLTRLKADLRGKHIACRCKPEAPCHGDVLLAIVNEVEPDAPAAG